MLDRIPGSYIKTTRLRLGWTQAAFAERIGITERVYQRREAVGMRRRQWELETDGWLPAELLIRAAAMSTAEPGTVVDTDFIEKRNGVVEHVATLDSAIASFFNPATPVPLDTMPATPEDAQFMSSDLLKQLDPK